MIFGFKIIPNSAFLYKIFAVFLPIVHKKRKSPKYSELFKIIYSFISSKALSQSVLSASEGILYPVLGEKVKPICSDRLPLSNV